MKKLFPLLFLCTTFICAAQFRYMPKKMVLLNGQKEVPFGETLDGGYKPNIFVFYTSAESADCADMLKEVSQFAVKNTNKVQLVYIAYAPKWLTLMTEANRKAIKEEFAYYNTHLKTDNSLFMADFKEDIWQYYTHNKNKRPIPDNISFPKLMVLNREGEKTFEYLGNPLDKGEDIADLLDRELDRNHQILIRNVDLSPQIQDALISKQNKVIFIESESESFLDDYLPQIGERRFSAYYQYIRFYYKYPGAVKMPNGDVLPPMAIGDVEKGTHGLTYSLLKGKITVPSIVFLNEENEIVSRLREKISPERFRKLLEYVLDDHYKLKSFSDFEKE